MLFRSDDSKEYEQLLDWISSIYVELIGIMVGSFVIGKLADKDGYLPFLRLSSILVFIGALVVYVTGSIDLLIHSLFVMGFGIGGDFALDSDYVDEVMPKRWQETMVGITKSFSALGNLSAGGDRKSTRLNSSHNRESRMPSSA